MLVYDFWRGIPSSFKTWAVASKRQEITSPVFYCDMVMTSWRSAPFRDLILAIITTIKIMTTGEAWIIMLSASVLFKEKIPNEQFSIIIPYDREASKELEREKDYYMPAKTLWTKIFFFWSTWSTLIKELIN